MVDFFMPNTLYAYGRASRFQNLGMKGLMNPSDHSTPNRFYCFPNIFDLDLESIKTYLAWKESSSTLLLPIHV